MFKYVSVFLLSLLTLGAQPQNEDKQIEAANLKPVENDFYIASQTDLGFLFFRPRFQYGYGQPFREFIALEANPIFSTSNIGGYIGGRIAVPQFDIRAGARYMNSLKHAYLDPQRAYNHIELMSTVNQKSRYLALETQLTTNLRAGPGVLRIEMTTTLVFLTPDDKFVFEETRKVILDPPHLFSGEFGYLFRFMSGWGVIGPVVEIVHVPKRSLWVLRGGILVSMKLFRNIEGRATFMPPLAGRDKLGLSGGDSVLVGIRHKWWSNL